MHKIQIQGKVVNMIELNVHTLDDNKEYCEISSIIDNGVEYLLLIEENNPRNICFRKVTIENEKEYLDLLTDNEYNYVKELFKNKIKDLLN